MRPRPTSSRARSRSPTTWPTTRANSELMHGPGPPALLAGGPVGGAGRGAPGAGAAGGGGGGAPGGAGGAGGGGAGPRLGGRGGRARQRAAGGGAPPLENLEAAARGPANPD